MGLRCTPIETLIVPTNGATITGPTLETGVVYEITASGTVNLSVGSSSVIMGDAEYAFGSIPTNTACGSPFPEIDLGITINNFTPGLVGTKVPSSWGAFDSTDHTYTIPFVGTGNPITFTYWDCLFSDNAGSITIDICRLLV